MVHEVLSYLETTFPHNPHKDSAEAYRALLFHSSSHPRGLRNPGPRSLF